MLFGKIDLLFQASLSLGCFFVWSCENDVSQIDNLLQKKTAIEEGRGIDSYLSEGGKLKARLTSPYMLRYQADSPFVEFPRTLHVIFYNDSAVVETTLDARYAKSREYDEKIFLRDSVVVINKLKGDTLRTDELWWDQKTEEFYTDKDVRIHQRDKTIFGKGLRGLQNFTRYTIDTITGIVLVPPDGIPK